MKKKIIAIVCLLLLLSCQKSNSSPAGSANTSPGDSKFSPSPSSVQEEWRKKLETCPLQLAQEMSLEQVAETSSQMRQRCKFTENEWAQVIRHSL